MYEQAYKIDNNCPGVNVSTKRKVLSYSSFQFRRGLHAKVLVKGLLVSHVKYHRRKVYLGYHILSISYTFVKRFLAITLFITP